MVGAEEACLAKIELFDQVQHFKHREALRRCGRLIQGQVAVLSNQRFTPACFLCVQIIFGKKSTVLLYISSQSLSDSTFVKTGAAFASN